MAQQPAPSGRGVLGEVACVVMIALGALGTLLASLLLWNMWLLASEALLVLGVVFGFRGSGPRPPEEDPTTVTIIEHTD